MKLSPAVLALLLLSCGGEPSDCALLAEGAYVPAPPPGNEMAAAYFTLTNECNNPVTLVGVDSQSKASLSVHRSSTDTDIARMLPVKELTIDANAQVEFKPGGLHVMSDGLPLKIGQTLTFELLFEGGERVPIHAAVTKRHAGAHGHSTHSSHDPNQPARGGSS